MRDAAAVFGGQRLRDNADAILLRVQRPQGLAVRGQAGDFAVEGFLPAVEETAIQVVLDDPWRPEVRPRGRTRPF
jgi:hypothetical protein